MSDNFQLEPGGDRRKEPHRCGCGARFEVGHRGDVLETVVQVDVRCPTCGKGHSVAVPRGTEKDLTVETVVGPEAEVGGGD